LWWGNGVRKLGAARKGETGWGCESEEQTRGFRKGWFEHYLRKEKRRRSSRRGLRKGAVYEMEPGRRVGGKQEKNL